MPSSAMEEYLEVIYKLAEKGDVRPSQIAEALGVSGPTVTAALKRLGVQGLATRPRGRVALTPEGRTQALAIIRGHRLSERFLADVLGLPLDEVHEEACLLEHALSPRVLEALAEFLQRPEYCPHGHPIPSADGVVATSQGESLCTRDIGERVEIVSVAEDDPGMLTYLSSLGLLPGTEILISDIAPFHGPLLVNVRGSQYALGREVADKIRVKSLDRV